MPRIICSKENTPTVCMLNVGDNPVKIRQGTEVGVVYPASVFQPMENSSFSTSV